MSSFQTFCYHRWHVLMIKLQQCSRRRDLERLEINDGYLTVLLTLGSGLPGAPLPSLLILGGACMLTSSLAYIEAQLAPAPAGYEARKPAIVLRWPQKHEN